MKRFRKPKLKDGQLLVYWGKLPHDEPDMIYSWQGDSHMKRDTALLCNYIGIPQPDPHAKPLFSKTRPHFHYVDGRRADFNSGAPIALVAYGRDNLEALRNSGLGFVVVGHNAELTGPQQREEEHGN